MPTPFQAFRRSLDISKYVLLSQRHDAKKDAAKHEYIIDIIPDVRAIIFFYNRIYFFSRHMNLYLKAPLRTAS